MDGSMVKHDSIASDARMVKGVVEKISEALQTRFDTVVWSNNRKGSKTNRPRVVRILVPKRTDARLNLLFLNTEAPLPLRVFIDVGEDSSLQLLECCFSKSRRLSALEVQHRISMAKRSSAEMNILHNENENTTFVGSVKAGCLEGSNLRMNFLYNGSRATKSENGIRLLGRAARAEINELVVGSKRQAFEIATTIVNSAKDSEAVLESRAVLMDGSSCLLKGSAEITKEASGSRSRLNERGILLDREACLSAIPSMRIGNSNVEATHSSATMPIDEEQLFYLMSRGASGLLAKRMIVNGFLSNGTSRINDIVAREIVASIINERMAGKRFGTVPRVTTESMWLAGTDKKGSKNESE